MPEQQPSPAPMTSPPISQEARISQVSAGSSVPNRPIPPPPLHDRTPQRIPYWLHQSERFLRVIVRLYIGLVVCLVPWYPPFWDSNPLFVHSPWLTAVITQGAFRGLISGLGLLNLWFAIRELILSAPQSESR